MPRNRRLLTGRFDVDPHGKNAITARCHHAVKTRLQTSDSKCPIAFNLRAGNLYSIQDEMKREVEDLSMSPCARVKHVHFPHKSTIGSQPCYVFFK